MILISSQHDFSQQTFCSAKSLGFIQISMDSDFEVNINRVGVPEYGRLTM